MLSALVVFITYVRERRARELSRVRSVAETAQRILLRPPPRRIGPLRVAWLYLAAEDEAQIGGDLLAIARADNPCTRVLIGDVRGHGLASIGEASVVMGAFREGAHRYVFGRRFDLARLDAVYQAGQRRENMFGDVLCRRTGYVGVLPDLGDSTLQAPLDVMDQLVCPEADLTRGTGHETARREVHKTTLRCTGVYRPSGFGERGPASARSALKPLTQARSLHRAAARPSSRP